MTHPTVTFSAVTLFRVTLFTVTLSVVSLFGLLAGCSNQQAQPSPQVSPTSDERLVTPVADRSSGSSLQPESLYVGSKSCSECHETFHEKWETSWHGLAMQPYTNTLANEKLTPQSEPVTIGERQYRVELDDQGGRIWETGPDGEKSYEMAHAMGGKNVYYFLTEMERGRLQVMPLAYDVNDQAWYDVAASGMRHFPDRDDEALDWTDRLFTFNTTCFNCHVSQLATNYDLNSDTYRTTWSEPGISCESCHGPASEHIRVFQEALPGEQPEDMKIIRTSEFTAQQMNDLCATCHAKMSPISTTFRPGDPFFDHFDLLTLEHPDYYPDGRDLGENYTMTSWMMSPCLKDGQFDCNHCHTSSGRMRFEGATINEGCLPCHQDKVDNPAAHNHHPPGTEGITCVACHMPMTRFAGMNRSDHSMRPPMPAATLAFESPNACNLCHQDKDAQWADQWVQKWHKLEGQDEAMNRARLIDEARRGQWQRLPEMLQHVVDHSQDDVHRNSLVRLLRDCPVSSKWPTILAALQDPSPLVRSSAASALGESPMTPDLLAGLLAATRDPVRLVRIRAAMALAVVPTEMIAEPRDRQSLDRAVEEFTTAMSARPDDWSSHANLGNFLMQRREYADAVERFETAHSLEPRSVGPMVNAAIAYSNLNQADAAERSLRRAIEAEPKNAAAQFNLGLLMGEQGKTTEAIQALRTAIEADPQMDQAAYNLGILLAPEDLDEAIKWCQTAFELRPDELRYAHSLAFYQHQHGQSQAAIDQLRKLIEQHSDYWDAYFLLGQIYEESSRNDVAKQLYEHLQSRPTLPPRLRSYLDQKVLSLSSESESE